MSKDLNKELISKAKELFKEKGYEVKTSHLYDIFAKLSGYKDWHTASAVNAPLSKSIKKFVQETDLSTYPKFMNGIKDFFINQQGEEVKFQLFDPALPAWNYAISGQTGSGKTLLLNKLLGMTMKEYTYSMYRPLIQGITLGEEYNYSKFIALFGGKQHSLNMSYQPKISFFAINPDFSVPHKIKEAEILDRLCLDYPEINRSELKEKLAKFYITLIHNKAAESKHLVKNHFQEIFSLTFKNEYLTLFKLKEGEVRPSPMHLIWMVKMIELMTSTSIKKLNSEYLVDESEIRSLIHHTYAQIGSTEQRFPTITDMINCAQSLEWDEELIRRMKRWSKYGPFGFLDAQVTELDLTHETNIFGLDGLSEEPTLQVAYAMVLDELFRVKAEEENRMCINILDEVTPLLKYSLFSDHMLHGLKTNRRRGMSTLMVCQSINDLTHFENHKGMEIIKEFNVHCLNKHLDSSSQEEVIKVLNLTFEQAIDFKKLGLIRTADHKPSHMTFMMLKNKSAVVYKNLLTPEEFTLYSTSLEDAMIMHYYLKIKPKFKEPAETLTYLSLNSHLTDKDLAEYLKELGFPNLSNRQRNN